MKFKLLVFISLFGLTSLYAQDFMHFAITANDSTGKPLNGEVFTIEIKGNMSSVPVITRDVQTGAAPGWDGKAGLQVAPSGPATWTVTAKNSMLQPHQRTGTYISGTQQNNLAFVKPTNAPAPSPTGKPASSGVKEYKTGDFVFRGVVTAHSCTEVLGWATMQVPTSTTPDRIISISVNPYEIVNGEKRFISSPQMVPGANGQSTFRWTVPSSLKNGQLHSIHFYFSSTQEDIGAAPVSLRCSQ